jgi:AcrR family transcriptional regulator
MGRTVGRSSEDTRRVALTAAARVLRARGMQATLDDIAREAGMSKGGLIYHFPSKDDLIRNLAVDIVERFRAHVLSCINPDDSAPGRLTRAYVRACFDATADAQITRETMSLMAQLIILPEVAKVADADSNQWAADLREDGLPATVRALVVTAADGASITPLWGGKPLTEEHAVLERQLIELTHHPEHWHDNQTT